MGTPVVVVHCELTVLFTLVGIHDLRHAFRPFRRVRCFRCFRSYRSFRPSSPGHRVRVDNVLHAAMALTMAAMLWAPGRKLPESAMTVFFAAAALWFPLTAVRRGAGNRATAIVGRLPQAAGMGVMVWMLRISPAGAAPSHENLAGPLPSTHPTTALGHAADPSEAGRPVTVLLVLYLLVCALWSLTRPMPALRSAGHTERRATASASCGHVRDGAMALGTAVMLLVPH